MYWIKLANGVWFSVSFGICKRSWHGSILIEVWNGDSKHWVITVIGRSRSLCICVSFAKFLFMKLLREDILLRYCISLAIMIILFMVMNLEIFKSDSGLISRKFPTLYKNVTFVSLTSISAPSIYRWISLKSPSISKILILFSLNFRLQISLTFFSWHMYWLLLWINTKSVGKITVGSSGRGLYESSGIFNFFSTWSSEGKR